MPLLVVYALCTVKMDVRQKEIVFENAEDSSKTLKGSLCTLSLLM